MGNLLKSGFKKLQDKFEQIGSVRGQGLMLGIEIVTDRESNRPDPIMMSRAFENLKDMGILMGKGGRNGNVFRVQPPMCISEADVNFTLQSFEVALRESL